MPVVRNIIMSSFKIFHSPKGEAEKHAYETRLEQRVAKALTPFEEFVRSQVVASSLLLVATLAALFFASLPYTATYYAKFIEFHLGIHISKHVFSADIKYWVNDILLTLFFLVLGLEIKREFLVGEFTNLKRASLIIIASFGSMLLPVLIYLAFNYRSPTIHGWGIPLPIGTAFTIGILALFRSKFPKGLISFIAAVAILDDICAILIIALFYSEYVAIGYLVVAICLLLILIMLNFAGIRHPLPYVVVGIGVWVMTELSGVHGTIVGIAVALTIPARPKIGPKRVVQRIKELMAYFELRKKELPLILADEKQHAVLQEVKQIAVQATTPLQRWERVLELPVALLILPLFVFANSGVPVSWHLLHTALYDPVALGIALALVVGKPLGIIIFSYLACKVGAGKLPRYVQFKQVVGASLLGGIGFTLSLFIAELSFIDNSQELLLAKMGIIIGSFLAGVLGTLWLQCLKRSPVCNLPTVKECL